MGRLRVWTCVALSVGISVAAVPVARAADYVVSLLPLRGLVTELAGPGVEVECLVGAGQAPETFEPTSRQITRLARADAVFTAGLPFEDALFARIGRQFPELRRVDVAAGIERLALPPMAAGDRGPDAGHDDSHDDGHGHDHGESDPHVWTGPTELRAIAVNIAAALGQLQPADAVAIAARLAAFEARITSLEAEIAERLRPFAGRAVLAYHPAFGYFCARYDLRQLAVESGGTEPGARHIVELAARVRREGVQLMVAPPQFSPDRARTLARSLEVEVVVFDPLREDVEAMLREFTELLVSSFSSAAAARAGGTR